MDNIQFKLEVSSSKHLQYCDAIITEIEASAKVRGTGIAKRSEEYVQKILESGKGIVALTEQGEWAGFCYIESWDHDRFVANSGLIVAPKFRNQGLARLIKKAIFDLSRQKYPDAKIFGLTTGLAVMKLNFQLGYQPVTYSELTQDEKFWNGCKTCINYEILVSKERKNCICTAMLYDPKKEVKPELRLTENPSSKKLTWKSILPLRYLSLRKKQNT
jgi:GNAT superfamily N-acetyltransferase